MAWINIRNTFSTHKHVYMSERSDFQRYLDEKFKGVMNELGHIRDNGERMNGKVAEHEGRIRNMEDNYNRCPIKQVEKDMRKLKEDTQNIRIWTKLVKGGFAMSALAVISLILMVLGLI